MTWLALLGWLLAGILIALVVDLRRRLELVARAEHELRGPLGALGLAAERVRRGAAGPEVAGLVEAQLDRSRAGLADLSRARGFRVARMARSRIPLEGFVRHAAAGWRPVAAAAGRRVRLDWRAGPVDVQADPGRLAQAIGNLLSNAIEHGQGEVEVRGRRVGERVRIEVANGGTPRRGARRPSASDRGRGLRIAGDAVEAVGGELTVGSDGARTRAVVELPLRRRA